MTKKEYDAITPEQVEEYLRDQFKEAADALKAFSEGLESIAARWPDDTLRQWTALASSLVHAMQKS